MGQDLELKASEALEQWMVELEVLPIMQGISPIIAR